MLLNQEITSRNGSFAMTGSAENITITSSGITSATNQRVEIPLTRLDAKIEVRIRAAVGNETRVESQSGSTVEVLKDFTPDSWQVVNLPKGCFLLEHAVAAEEDTMPIRAISTATRSTSRPKPRRPTPTRPATEPPKR